MKRKLLLTPILFSILIFNIHGFEIEGLQERIGMIIIKETAKNDDLYTKLITMMFLNSLTSG
jgi:hypothetical protein